MINNGTINCNLMYKNEIVCEIVFKNGYFFRLKKVINESL